MGAGHGFNEAAGIHRRKRAAGVYGCLATWSGFNEAAGIHRRKRRRGGGMKWPLGLASMRPPEFTGGNPCSQGPQRGGDAVASMRPPEFTGGNRRSSTERCSCSTASMRPPEFTGGNASGSSRCCSPWLSFNEAAGIHRRKPFGPDPNTAPDLTASMRPPEFTGGNDNDRSEPHWRDR